MFFKRKKRTPLNRKKNNWLSPQLLGSTFIIVALMLMLIFAPHEEEQPADYVSSIISKPVSAIYSVRNFVRGTINNLVENFHAKAELDAVREKLEKVQKENIELQYKLRQHENYREALNLPREEPYITVPSVVCRRDNRLTNALIINKGIESGLSINQAVMTSTGLVGRTYRLRDHVAWVQLLTDPGCTIPVYVKETPYEGLLRGTEDSEHLLLTDLYLTEMGEETQTPEPGQAVFTSGAGKVFERGLLAGYITSATNEEGYSVVPAVDFNTIKAVFVIKSTAIQQEIVSLLPEE